MVRCLSHPFWVVQPHWYGQPQSLSYFVSIAAPVVSDGRSANRPFTVALSLTVAGLNFAVVDQTASADVATITCSTASWTSGTSVACLQGGTAAPADRSVVVTISAGFVGTAGTVFSFDGVLRCRHQ